MAESSNQKTIETRSMRSLGPSTSRPSTSTSNSARVPPKRPMIITIDSDDDDDDVICLNPSQAPVERRNTDEDVTYIGINLPGPSRPPESKKQRKVPVPLDCTICKSEFARDAGNVFTSQCGHLYCQSCVELFFRYQGSGKGVCAICRSAMLKSKMRQIFF